MRKEGTHESFDDRVLCRGGDGNTIDDDSCRNNCTLGECGPEIEDGIDNSCPGAAGYCKIDEGFDFELLGPAHGSLVTDAPLLTWAAGRFDWFRVIITLPLYGITWTVNSPWIPCSSYSLSFLPLYSFFWSHITYNTPARWMVMGVDVDGLQSTRWAIAGPFVFTKVP